MYVFSFRKSQRCYTALGNSVFFGKKTGIEIMCNSFAVFSVQSNAAPVCGLAKDGRLEEIRKVGSKGVYRSVAVDHLHLFAV